MNKSDINSFLIESKGKVWCLCVKTSACTQFVKISNSHTTDTNIVSYFIISCSLNVVDATIKGKYTSRRFIGTNHQMFKNIWLIGHCLLKVVIACYEINCCITSKTKHQIFKQCDTNSSQFIFCVKNVASNKDKHIISFCGNSFD